MTERIIRPDEIEYKKLAAVAALLEMLSPHKARYVVRDVYLDFGQDWKWTTICREGWSECQILCPRDWQTIMESETAADIAEIVDEIRRGEYFGDGDDVARDAAMTEIMEDERAAAADYYDERG